MHELLRSRNRAEEKYVSPFIEYALQSDGEDSKGTKKYKQEAVKC